MCTKYWLTACSSLLRKKNDIFTDRSEVVLLLWIIYVISVLFCYDFMNVCLLMPCGHLLEKADLLALVCDV